MSLQAILSQENYDLYKKTKEKVAACIESGTFSVLHFAGAVYGDMYNIAPDRSLYELDPQHALKIVYSLIDLSLEKEQYFASQFSICIENLIKKMQSFENGGAPLCLDVSTSGC